MLVFVGILLQYVHCSLENDMLKQTNKHRVEHSMEELYNLPSLQKAADLQVLHMCKKSRLTHDGPDKNTMTLAGRLKEFDFIGLNIGENIAKQGNDDYKEVVKLWMKSEKHRNNILGDYVYSGVATCIGKDNNRYWVQVFGKDMSNTRIAKIRDGMDPKELCEEGDEQKENRDASSSNKPKHSKRKGKEIYGREEPGVEGRNGMGAGYQPPKSDGMPQNMSYIMLLRPPGDQSEGRDSYGDSPEAKDKKQNEIDNKYIKDFLESGEGMNYSIRQRGMLNFDSRNSPYMDWRYIRRNKPIAGKSYGQRIKDMNEDEKMWRESEKSGLLNFGDYLLSSTSQGDGNNPPGVSTQKTSPGSGKGAEPRKADPSIKVLTSTTSILTFVFKNPNNSSVLPAIQSLVEIIKNSEQNSSDQTPSISPSVDKSSVGSLTMLSTTVSANPSVSSVDGVTKGVPVLSKSIGYVVVTPTITVNPKSELKPQSAGLPNISPLVVTKITTTTIYREPASSMSNVSESSISTKSHGDSYTTSSEASKTTVTTTVYLPGRQKPGAAAQRDESPPSDASDAKPLSKPLKPQNQEDLRATILRLLNSGSDSPNDQTDPKGRSMGPGALGGQNEKPMKSQKGDPRSIGGKGDLKRPWTRDPQSNNSNKNECPNGYNDDGSCTQLKASDEDKLKNMLENLIRKGRLHLHVLPAEKECPEGDECTQKEIDGIDIGIPFSYTP